jgi:tRNA-Thr(GGU) m(6)t(6)A37 methyltransferase TsaA
VSTAHEQYTVEPIGCIESTLRDPAEAPKQGPEGAPDAWLVVRPELTPAMTGIDELVVVTWLHRGRREVLQVHPRDDATRPLMGVFATRSQDRPNPLGLHRVTVRAVQQNRLRVGPIEAIDGTPVVDVKIGLPPSVDV